MAAIRYSHITISTPNIRCGTLEDHAVRYDIILGVTMADHPDDKKAEVISELEKYIRAYCQWQMHARIKVQADVVHDLSQQNILSMRRRYED